jgi:hypothetical protein
MADTQQTSSATPDNTNVSNALNLDLGKIPSFFQRQQDIGIKASEAKIRAESAQKAAEKGAEAEVLEDYAKKYGAKYEEVKAQMKPEPEFKPTQENALDLGAIFSMIATMGVALGGSGKLSSLNALNAMSGMLQGYQQGRKDLFTKEQQKFDKELASIKAHNETLLKDLDQYSKLLATDRDAAMAKKAEIVAKNPGVIAQLVEAGRWQVASDTAKSIAKMQSEAYVKSIKTGVSAGKTGGALLAGRAENIREAYVQAAQDIVNVTRFPPDTMLGIFAGLTGADASTMAGGIRNGIARGITDKEQRALETLLSGIEGHMAFALGGGYASSQSKARIDQYKAQLARAGDDPSQVPLMLARFRQEMNILAENFPSKPGATEEMNKAVQAANNRINSAVPFTVEDVMNAEYGASQTSTAQVTPTPVPVSAPTQKPVPTEADRERARSNPKSRENFIRYFGVEP